MPRLILRASLVYAVALVGLAMLAILSMPLTLILTYIAPGSRYLRKWIEH